MTSALSVCAVCDKPRADCSYGNAYASSGCYVQLGNVVYTAFGSIGGPAAKPTSVIRGDSADSPSSQGL